jgi:hypothetical protein
LHRPLRTWRTADSKTPVEAVAPPSQDLRSADTRTAADLVAPASQDLRSADARVDGKRVAGPTVVFETETVPDSGGLSTLLIVLITLGASTALAAAAFSAQRLVHARHTVA